jgi:hypothetical protein
MLWLIPVLLSFDIIEAIVPVIIILVLIAAAAGLTRGTDIFALFGLGTIMGFANAGSGRVGKGFKGTRYGADSIKRGRAAGKAKKGLIKKAKKAKANYAQAKAKAPAARNRLRMQAKNRVNKRLAKLQKKGLGNSPRAKKLQGRLAKINASINADTKARKVADKILGNPGSKMAVSGLAGGMALSAASISKLNGKKISGRASKLNFQLNNQIKKESDLKQQHMIHGIYKQRVTDFDKISKATRYASISKNGVRIGHVPRFNNYVKTINTKTGTPVNVLKIPKSAFFQKGATNAVIMSFLQKHWIKQIESGSQHAGRAERRLGKLNDIVAKMHYGESSATSAFESAKHGKLRSNTAKGLNNLVSFGLPMPGGRLVGRAAGRRYHEERLQKFPNEDYWTYRDRSRDYDKIMREMNVSKNHTILHPIAGRHGSASIEEKRKKVWLDAYNEALKGIKK